MPTTYFTSDLHFSHKNIMKFCPQFRSYASIKEMDAALIAQWNATVAPEDTVYSLGDISFARDAASIARVLQQLNGEHHLILGNHDEVIAKNRDYFLHTTKADGKPLLASIKNYRQVACDGCSQPLVLFHYPIQEWTAAAKAATTSTATCTTASRHCPAACSKRTTLNPTCATCRLSSTMTGKTPSARQTQTTPAHKSPPPCAA